MIEPLSQTNIAKKLLCHAPCHIPVPAAYKSRHHYILKGSKLRQKMVKLKHKTYIFIPEHGKPLVSLAENPFALVEDIALCRPVQRTHEMEKCAFSATICPDHSNHPTFQNRKFNALKHIYRLHLIAV